MKRILFVDDDEAILEVVTLILRDAAYEVMAIGDGLHIIERVKSYDPDLILLDIVLGDLDGRELCAVIKSDPKT